MSKSIDVNDLEKIHEQLRVLQETLKAVTGKHCELVLLAHKVHDAPDEVCEGVTIFTEVPMEDTAGMMIKATNNVLAVLRQQPAPPGTTLN